MLWDFACQIEEFGLKPKDSGELFREFWARKQPDNNSHLRKLPCEMGDPKGRGKDIWVSEGTKGSGCRFSKLYYGINDNLFSENFLGLCLCYTPCNLYQLLSRSYRWRTLGKEFK